MDSFFYQFLFSFSRLPSFSFFPLSLEHRRKRYGENREINLQIKFTLKKYFLAKPTEEKALHEICDLMLNFFPSVFLQMQKFMCCSSLAPAAALRALELVVFSGCSGGPDTTTLIININYKRRTSCLSSETTTRGARNTSLKLEEFP